MLKKRSMFEIIKKQNGERFAKAIRSFDGGIFDIPNIDEILKYADKNPKPIIKYLSSLKGIHIEDDGIKRDPFELLYQAGYHAQYADTLEKQNSIEPYFTPSERLCTFDDPTRYQKYYIINAVKHNAAELNRTNFKHPKREDEYGTSVISIQILKKGGVISIKNRYNHSIDNPDNTYNSNPDNIIYGLSAALKNYFNVDFSSQQEPLGKNYVLIKDKILKYNYEINNVYYGKDFIAYGDQIYSIDKRSQIIMDYFIFDFKQKQILKDFNGINLTSNDCFADIFNQEISGTTIQIKRNPNKSHTILADGYPVVEIKDGTIRYLSLTQPTSIGANFLLRDKTLRKINLPNVKEVGDCFLRDDKVLSTIEMQKCEKVGHQFLYHDTMIRKIYLPEVVGFGDEALHSAKKLRELYSPKCQSFGDWGLYYNTDIKDLRLPDSIKVGQGFLHNNKQFSARYNQQRTNIFIPYYMQQHMK